MFGLEKYDFTKRHGKKELDNFAAMMYKVHEQVGFKQSARGWCYQLETFGAITKAEFDKVENIINKCRRRGVLPIDFVAEEEARQFSGVEEPDTVHPATRIASYLEAGLKVGADYYTPDWWAGEEYYIQMVVEKIDLKTLFEPKCSQYHIPIATSRGWSSLLQRAEYAKRFAMAVDLGLTPVLLYCGDYDPDGLRITDFLYKNLEDVQHVIWEDGTGGFNPELLIIERFGLNLDYINKNKLTWIDNLITARKRDLAHPSHPNYKLPYMQRYLKKVGVRKCEANAIVTEPQAARDLCESTIVKYVGKDALRRFAARRQEVVLRVEEFKAKHKIVKPIQKVINIINKNT